MSKQASKKKSEVICFRRETEQGSPAIVENITIRSALRRIKKAIESCAMLNKIDISTSGELSISWMDAGEWGEADVYDTYATTPNELSQLIEAAKRSEKKAWG